jgi:alkaline phosphatase
MLATSPTLTELSRAALNKLNADPDGFYVSIEGGAVDRAMHANNFGRMIEEYVEFNDTVKFVIDWVNSPESRATWEDTLLIVTADHDHLLFGLDGGTISYQPVLPDQDGDGVPEYALFSNNHSNQIIPLYAYGAEAEEVRALADDRDVVLDAQGRPSAGSGRTHTDQAELGDFLLEQLGRGAGVTAGDYSALGA